jgi:hypothetical protein
MRSIMMNTKLTSNCKIAFYGLVFAIAYLYFNDLIYVCRLKPDRFEQYLDRSIPQIWRDISYLIWKVLLCLSLPAGMIAGKFYEPYFTELVYYPLLAGPLWFGYGCILRWAYITKRFFIVTGSLLILWVAFVFIGWRIAIF